MKGLQTYIIEAYNELLHKVSWPSWDDLAESAVIVLVASIIIALVVLLMDQASSNLLKLLYELIIGG